MSCLIKITCLNNTPKKTHQLPVWDCVTPSLAVFLCSLNISLFCPVSSRCLSSLPLRSSPRSAFTSAQLPLFTFPNCKIICVLQRCQEQNIAGKKSRRTKQHIAVVRAVAVTTRCFVARPEQLSQKQSVFQRDDTSCLLTGCNFDKILKLGKEESETLTA